jgi:hypothetical protein
VPHGARIGQAWQYIAGFQRHCEERSDEASSTRCACFSEIASLRSQ